MAPVLLVTAVPGFLVMLTAAWLSFLGNGPYNDPSITPPPDIRFIDRATRWTTTGPASASGWATLAALTAFTVVMWSRRHQHPAASNTLRQTAAGLTALLSVLELTGPLTVAAGWFQLSRDPTSARSFWTEMAFKGPSVVLCLVFTVLAALLTWTLWFGLTGDEDPPQSATTDAPAFAPRADQVKGTTTAGDPGEVFRRPRN
jgi:hypothetical protein